MGIDAVAVLRIPKLKATDALGAPLHIEHRGDCSLHHTHLRFHGAAPDEHALALRKELGGALDAHHDPRGICFFPESCQPKGKSYEAIIAELGRAGIWAPKVGADHVPLRISQAKPGTYDDLLRRALASGGEATQATVEMAWVYFLMTRDGKATADVVTEYQQELARVGKAMGEPFVAEMEKVFAAREAADKLQTELSKMVRGLDVEVGELAPDELGSVPKKTTEKKASVKKPAAKKPPSKKRR